MRIGIVGSGLIGTDLLVKLQRHPALELAGVAGSSPTRPGSPGLASSASPRRRTASRPCSSSSRRSTSSWTRRRQLHTGSTRALLAERDVFCIDLTPAALGPAVVPDVNLDEHLGAAEVNLVTCGAQATVPVVAAVARVASVPYAEIVSTVASRSAGPGTRANIDEFTTATARSLETLGGAARGKALIVLNPAEPPITMRNAIHLRLGAHDADEVRGAVDAAVAGLQRYVPGYRLTAAPVDGRGPRDRADGGRGRRRPPAAVCRQPRRDDRGGRPRLRGRGGGEAAAVSVAAVTVFDATLRDGSHAIRHQFTVAQVREIAAGLDAAGVPSVGVGHGDGLGGSSLQLGEALHSDEELLAAAAGVLRRARLAVTLVPGIGTKEHLRRAADARRPARPHRDALHRGRHRRAAHRPRARALASTCTAT